MKHRLQIDYSARYSYEEPVSLSLHRVRIFPRSSLAVRLLESSFDCPESGDIQFRRDLYENEIAQCFFPENLSEFNIRFSASLEITEKNPFHFLLDEGGREIPPTYSPQERLFLSSLLQNDGAKNCPLPSPLAPSGKAPSLEKLGTWNRWIFDNFRYQRRDEGPARHPSETLKRGEGACRDFTALLVETLRQNGVAARWVSGYLWELGDKESHVAESALHAWAEAYLPGAGWIGLDPTNGTLTDHTAIPTAIGPDADATNPVAGTYFSKSLVTDKLETNLKISELLETV
ncbi:MAG: transglutaminase domain-containing protein [Chthoniobacterales bacterium]